MSTQTMIASDELFIGGEWIKPQGPGRISVLAASTEEPVGSVPDGTNADIDVAVRAARAAFDDPSERPRQRARGRRLARPGNHGRSTGERSPARARRGLHREGPRGGRRVVAGGGRPPEQERGWFVQ